MSRRPTRRVRRRREAEVRRLARTGDWFREPARTTGPGWSSVGGAQSFQGTMPRVLILAVGDGPHNHRVRLSDVARLPRRWWRFLWNPTARRAVDAWPFRCEFVSFFDDRSTAMANRGDCSTAMANRDSHRPSSSWADLSGQPSREGSTR